MKSYFLKDLFFCLSSAILLILSFPRENLWIFAWFGFVPLFFALQSKSKAKVFLLSYLAGIIFWSGIIYWLVHVTLPGTILLILYLALYFGIFGLLIKTHDPRPTTHDLIFIPSVWVLLEYTRAYLFTGFPWALLGYSQYLNLPIIQISDLTGAWGISFLVMMVNAFIYQVIGSRSWVVGRKTKNLSASLSKQYVLFILILFLSLGYGYYKLYLSPITYHLSPIKIAVIQGNIPQELKWDPEARGDILSKYVALTQAAALENPDLIIWPEAASPGLLGEDDAVFEEIFSLSKKSKTPLLIGSVAREGQNYFNSAILIDTLGGIAMRYDKLHLVPFGEYIPLKRALPFLETVVPIGDMTPGKTYTIFKVAGRQPQAASKFAVLICFEDLFPKLSRSNIRQGANFLVNITNDAWYKETSAPYQHLQAAVFRAVENRVWLVRAANTGISGFIQPDGKVAALVRGPKGEEIFAAGYSSKNIYPQNGSFYTRYGDIFVLGCLLFILYGIMRKRKIKKLKVAD